METGYKKPLPRLDEDSVEFWQGCKRHELLIEQCQVCLSYYFPHSYCTKCSAGLNSPWAANMRWVKASGKGRILTFFTMNRPWVAAFKDDIPYNVALIGLDEGPDILSRIVECPPEEIKVGMPVEVVFRDVTEEFSLPMFRPVRP